MTVKALVFDAYGTLFNVHSVATRCESFWPGKGSILSQTWRSKQLEYTWLRSLMAHYADFEQITADALRHACDVYHLECGDTHIAALLEEYRRLETFPEVMEVIATLKGRRLAILSNGSPAMLDAVVHHAGLHNDLAAVISVDELKCYKPDPRVYQMAVDKLHVSRQDIGFVSSNCWDACGAKHFGFETFWANRSGLPLDPIGAVPDHLLTSLRDLLPLLT